MGEVEKGLECGAPSIQSLLREKDRFMLSSPCFVKDQQIPIVHAKHCILRQSQREFGNWGESLFESG